MTDDGVLRDVAERAAELATRTGAFLLLVTAVVLLGRALRPLVRRRLLAGVQLLRDPFEAGDEFRGGAFQGRVEGVTVHETRLRTPAGQRVLLPNALVHTSALEVLTHDGASRVTFPVVLDSGADLESARRVSAAALADVRGVRSEPAPDAVVTDAGIGQTTVERRSWTAATAAGITAARDAAIPAVLAALTAAGVTLAPGEVLLREVPVDDDADTREAAAAAPTRGHA